MNKEVIGLKHRFQVILPILGILPLILLFFPFMKLGENQAAVSGVKILQEAVRSISTQGGSFYANGIVLIYGICTLGIAITGVWVLIAPKRPVVMCNVIFHVIYLLGCILVLFCAKNAVDSSGLSEVRFLIKYFSVGYWGSLLIGLLGLVNSMLTVKINPGYIVLITMSVIWLFPIFWIILNSFREESGFYVSYFFPKNFTLNNYVELVTDSSRFDYSRWFCNTLIVAVCSCILTSGIVLSTSFVLSRIRFQGRKTLMNLLLILGMFPGFMSMIAIYYILKGMGLTQSLLALVIVYSAGASLGYYISKGFFDTIPKALDEAACIDGATKWDVFTKITIPLSKPIIIYTVLTSFMSPWADYIFSSIILGDKTENYTVALGLFAMLDRTNIEAWYTKFAAGSVLVSVPIAILFICLQKYYVEGLSGSVKG